jgi:tetratricopeptide (TPR) repeat protein
VLTQNLTCWSEGFAIQLKGESAKALLDFDEALRFDGQAIESRPNDPETWRIRGNTFARIGQWDKAAADYAKVTELGEQPATVWYQRALLHLGAGQLDQYRLTCQRMLERFGKNREPEAGLPVVQAYRLAESDPRGLAPVVQLAEKAVASNPKDPVAVRLLGQILYRARQFERAAKRLEEAMQLYGGQSHDFYDIDALFLAMANQQLGRPDQARQWLDRVAKKLDQANIDKSIDSDELDVAARFNRLVVQLLRPEADGLIKAREP